MPSSSTPSPSTWSTSCWRRCGARRAVTPISLSQHRPARSHHPPGRPPSSRSPPAPDARVLAVRLQAPGEALVLEEVPVPNPSGTQVLVRVAGCGVCHTDLHITRGEMPRVVVPITLGHEVSGWVDAWGPEAAASLHPARLRRGDPVLVFGGWGCGECADCRSGEEQRCAAGSSPGFQVDGGYAERMLVPDARHLVPLGGTDATLAQCAGLLGPGGLLMIVGEGGGALRFGFAAPAVESWATTSAWGSVEELRQVVAIAAAGALTWDVEPMPLAQAAAAHAR